MLCVISDVEFDRGGKMDKHAGVNFIKYVKSHIYPKLPIILQSSENQQRALVAQGSWGCVSSIKTRRLC